MKELLSEQEIKDTINAVRHLNMPNRAQAVAETALMLMLPYAPVSKDWAPDRCPRCGRALSEPLGDGGYSRPDFLDRCPECGQRLVWLKEEL